MSRKNCFLVGLMLAAFSSITFAQSTAILHGTVSDQSGAVVPGAKVSVRNLATAFERVIQSDSAGNYLIAALPPGSYQLKVEQAGFKTFVQTSLTLEVDQNVRLDIA